MSDAPQVAASDVAIIVPVGGAAPAWKSCADSLSRLDPAPGDTIVVIDGPHEDLVAVARRTDFTVVALEERGGPAVARNFGAKATDREILFFLDADIVAPVDVAARVAEIFSADRELTAVFGSYDDTPGDPAFISQYRNLLHHYVHQKGREAASTFWAGCGAIRREAFAEVGGFDENYPVPSIEDIELGARLRRLGHTIQLTKDLQVKHLKKWRLRDMLATDLFRRAAPWTELMLREGEMINDLNVTTRDRASVVLALIPFVTFPAAWLWPPLAAVGVVALILLCILNAGLLRFFLRERGLFFTLRAVPMYWAYLVICALGFAIGWSRHFWRRYVRREA